MSRTTTSRQSNRRFRIAKVVVAFAALATLVGVGHADASSGSEADQTETIVDFDVHLDSDLVGTELDDSQA